MASRCPGRKAWWPRRRSASVRASSRSGPGRAIGESEGACMALARVGGEASTRAIRGGGVNPRLPAPWGLERRDPAEGGSALGRDDARLRRRPARSRAARAFRSTVETDAPVDNHGKGEAFSPTDLLAASLGSCMLTTMAIAGEREGWSLEGARARVEKHMQLEPRRRVGRIVIELEMPDGLPEDARPRLEAIARGCPVATSLADDTRVELSMRWG